MLAVEQTAGEVLYYNNKLVETCVYSASNGGRIKSSQERWGGVRGYLVAKDDPYDTGSGNGHGVGMSQNGAKNMASKGFSYKDIVVLLRSTSNLAPLYEQEILSQDMPVFSDSSQEYLDSIEIQTIMSLLKIIDNPIQDIPLVTVLRSFIGKFSDDELVQIRLSDKYDDFYTCMKKASIDVGKELKEKIENFLGKLESWRKEQEYLALDELIWKIYMDTGFYNYVGLMPNGNLRQANLKMLFQKAKKYENANFKGLYNFINFIDKIKLSSGDLGSAKLIGENDNVIRIMSIHKSKGLEFPVVFLSSTGKQFNLIDLNQNLLLHQDMGIRC